MKNKGQKRCVAASDMPFQALLDAPGSQGEGGTFPIPRLLLPLRSNGHLEANEKPVPFTGTLILHCSLGMVFSEVL
mgnify:CR=1 FL=1